MPKPSLVFTLLWSSPPPLAPTIQPNDVLEVYVYGQPELCREVVVLPDGCISYPLIGEIEVEGLTTAEAARAISQGLSYYFSNPLVSVTFKKQIWPKVSVLGCVRNPGFVDYQRGMNILDYLALAGWVTADADLSRCTILRHDSHSPRPLTINLADILAGRATDDVDLGGWDVIYVPRKSRINWSHVFYAASALTNVVTLVLLLTNAVSR